MAKPTTNQFIGIRTAKSVITKAFYSSIEEPFEVTNHRYEPRTDFSQWKLFAQDNNGNEFIITIPAEILREVANSPDFHP